ncbi:MAG: hypothetical protein A2268_12090 [Candidatus Raymondbacteria bacterium RifOxyA12_full_50_37]|nr:MAG: hypothetical protein A2268_12090 [Candidatus Raymondbacteria bacterium RifOxyA12_full_50_37]OGJ86063.1 MAG: hypothetical protein A2248_02085 [Candidatus Raymondbacteria bacterium RIFOXYA2_FULL_49_16]OGJ95960.1 MAG: hypothetical protein A2453_05490 [Candidatus Raymondbacteria bacterium RIFOXYC2_FULL_50_21]OGP40401.1 MAG: hypothetical protein A2324_11820 [Candidatus Raymondbacteria bacterium RIFOXYB2_FULL_49_35]
MVTVLYAADPGPRNLLSGTFSEAAIVQSLLPAEKWRPYPVASDHPAWQALPQKLREAQIQLAEKSLDAEWPTPKASVLLDFARNGNRTRYEGIHFSRRGRLAAQVIAECMEGKGRFLDDIADGIWTICEETYWGLPAHLNMQKKGSGLPDATEPTVDLFAAETGMLLAWTDYLLGPQLDSVSLLLRERIRFETSRRVLSPCFERDDFWWMGFADIGRPVNNWNPWICSNWLTAALLLEKDPDRRTKTVHKILLCLDNFLNPYPSDGGCDEGPSYWNVAGGALYDCLDILNSVSAGKMTVFNDPLIKEIGRYICRVHVSGPYYINFADASVRASPDPSTVFRFGTSIQDPVMTSFGVLLAKKHDMGNQAVTDGRGVLRRVLPTLFSPNAMTTAPGAEPLLADVWMPGIQVMAARSKQGSSNGLYIAAQGGHNEESHNHNDVGNFIVYADGQPVIIDIGVETYTKKTFSSDRYSIWTMQSAYHNCPTINGVMQKNGREFCATDVAYTATKKKAVFRLDLAKAYLPEAGVKTWKREITFNRNKNILIADSYELSQVRDSTRLTLMTCLKPDITKQGVVTLLPAVKSRPVSIGFDANKLSPRVETIELKDAKLVREWGNTIFRISFTAKQLKTADSYVMTIKQ